MGDRTGILIVGFGGPTSLEAVGPFMENLMGRAPSEELLAQVRTRYLAIGGASPLPEIASSIADKLAEKLGGKVPVAVGMRYWHPFIEDSMRGLVEAGCDRLVVVSLSPFESKVAQQAYRDEIARVAAVLGDIEIVEAPLISEMPVFVDYMAGGLATAISDIEPSEGAIVAFTAHSLPEDEFASDDTYVQSLRRVASAVAAETGMSDGEDGAGAPMFEKFKAFGSSSRPRAWYLVYQSKGRKPGKWLGPELDELIDAAAEAGVKGIVVCPIGFATDHMETRYDLDIVAADRALGLDIEFVRSPVLNDDHRLIDAIAEAISGLV